MHARFLAIMGAAAVLGLVGCGQQNGPPGDYGSVQGVVSDSRTNAPIAGAQVCIFVVECQPTAADGTYKISTVPSDPPGVLETITASAAGYVSASQQVQISNGKPALANFSLVHT